MRAICTITTHDYIEYTEQLIRSIRDTGYDDKICVFSCDEDISVDADKIYHIPPSPYTSMGGSRTWWNKTRMHEPFSNNDEVMYLDSDIIVQKGFEKLFSADFACPVVQHGDAFTDKLNELLGWKTKDRYMPCAFSFRGDKWLLKSWDVVNAYANSNGYDDVFGLNLLAYLIIGEDVYDYPRNRLLFTVDMKEGKEITDKHWIIHYGGKKGKELWQAKYGK